MQACHKVGEGVQAKWVWRSTKCSSASAANDSGLCSGMLSNLFCLLGPYSILYMCIYIHIYIHIGEIYSVYIYMYTHELYMYIHTLSLSPGAETSFLPSGH